MKKQLYTLAFLTSLTAIVNAQNVGINTDGSNPDGDAILHINNHSASGVDSSIIRIENEQNGANDVTGLELYNSGTGATARWDVYIPASGSTDLRFKNNGTDHITIQNDGDVGIGTTSPVSGLDVQTSMGLALTTITSATTLDNTHNVVFCNSGPYTVTLPAAASNTGKVYYIKNIDADGDIITIDGNGSEQIEGATTYLLNLYKHAVRIISDGSNWHVLEKSGTQIISSNFAYINCDGSYMAIIDVINPTTGKIWMDRNLGASKAATSSTDSDAYGDFYQWGRLADGHQCRTSGTTTTLSTTDVPGHSNFILNSSTPFDWLTVQNDNLWQGVNGVNNPCPVGYRLPTSVEWTAERNSWSSGNAAGAFGSVLALTLAGGGRQYNTGSIVQVGTSAAYHSSSLSGVYSLVLGFNGSSNWSGTVQRAGGFTVRCIKD